MANSTVRVNVIVPAAGWGTRVGSPEAKELFLRENSAEGQHLIDFPLLQARLRGWSATVILRKEKASLVKYLSEHFPEVKMIFVESTKEWPESILRSAAEWLEFNVLFLPDMTFAPLYILDDLITALTSAEISLAGFSVESAKTWGVFDSKKGFAEKPGDSGPAWAWGLMGFKKEIGLSLFQSLLQSSMDHQFYPVKASIKQLTLTHFKDLTR